MILKMCKKDAHLILIDIKEPRYIYTSLTMGKYQ